MGDQFVVVGGMVHRGGEQDTLNLRTDAWSVALDQRAFGPRKLVVAFAEPDGNVLSLAYADRVDPPEESLEPCIRRLGLGASLAIAFCDEPVVDGPPPDDLADRFGRAREIAASWGIHLVDWFACDDDLIRSSRLAACPAEDWWDAPTP